MDLYDSKLLYYHFLIYVLTCSPMFTFILVTLYKQRGTSSNKKFDKVVVMVIGH